MKQVKRRKEDNKENEWFAVCERADGFMTYSTSKLTKEFAERVAAVSDLYSVVKITEVMPKKRTKK